MAMKSIIMLHGNPLSGKSTAARKIKDNLDKNGFRAEIIKSVSTRLKKRNIFSRDFVDENIEETKKEKDDAYKSLCIIAENNINKKIIPILDATFHKNYRREWVYEVGKKTNSDVIIVWLEFSDADGIKKMLKLRRDNHNLKDNILSIWGQYMTMVQQMDSIKNHEIEGNEKAKMIRFDREKRSFNFYNCDNNNEIIGIICNALVSGE